MRELLLIVAWLAVSTAHAQTVRVAPLGAPSASGAAGAAPAGASALLPGAALPAPAAGLGSLPTLLAPVRMGFSPVEGQPSAAAGATAPRVGAAVPRAGTAAQRSASMSPTHGEATSRDVGADAARKNRVPPEQGLLLPQTVPVLTRQARPLPEASVRSPSRSAVVGRQALPLSVSAAQRLRFVAPWLRPGSANDDLARTLDSLFSGRLLPGQAGSPQSAAASRQGRVAQPPAAGAGAEVAPSATKRTGDAASALAPAVRDDGVLGRPWVARQRSMTPTRVAINKPASHSSPATRTDRRHAALRAGVAAAKAYNGTEAAAPPRLLRLGRLEAGSGLTGMGLLILDAPAQPRALNAAEAQEAAALALARPESAPSNAGDRLFHDRALVPLPARSSNHGWLAFWTAAAASRVVIARAF